MNELVRDDKQRGGEFTGLPTTKMLAALAMPNPSANGSHGKSQPPMTPIFKTATDLKAYRDYLREGGALLAKAKGRMVFPLPKVTLHPLDEVELEKGIARLGNVMQITISYYMRQASPEMRTLWRDQAYALNIAAADSVPEDLIKGVCAGYKEGNAIPYTDKKTRDETRDKTEQQHAL